jgi:hypothetical protein
MMNEPVSKADLLRAVDLSAAAVKQMLMEEQVVKDALEGKYDMDLTKLAGQMQEFGKRAMERAEARQPGTDWNLGWETGARWMLEKMVGYVTGERL